MGRRSGFTLIETLLAVIVVSVMTLMAFPRVNTAISKSNVRGARTRLANMLATARAAASQNARTGAFLRFNGNTAVVTATPRRNLPTGANTEDTLGTVVNLNGTYGVTLAAGIGAVQYDPRGIAVNVANGGNGIWLKVAKSGYRDSLLIDQLGEGNQVKRHESGFTLVEVLLAVTVLGIGITALVGSSALVTRMVSRGQMSTRAAEVASARLDALRLMAYATTPHCTHASFASGSVTSSPIGVTENWTVAGAGKTRTVTETVTYKTGRGTSRSEVLVTIIGC